MHVIQKPSSNKSGAGFTLLEMAIVVLIFGVALAAFAPAYKLYLTQQEQEKTQSNIEYITSAIGNFRSVNGAYPCPASLTETRTDATYGRQKCAVDASIAPGNPDGPLGQWVEESTRTLDYADPFTAGYPMQTAVPARVRVGFIPFRQLNLDEKIAYDSYGNRMMYVVTEHLTNPDTFSPTGGGINIIDAAGQSVVTPDSSAHFFVFSYGKDGNGAYSKDGTRLPCPAGLEQENCDQGTAPQATYRVAEANIAGGAGAYDDVVSYFTQSDVPLWQVSVTDRFAIHDKLGGEVGLGYEPTTGLSKKLDITGALRAQDDPVTVDDGNAANGDEIEGKIMSAEMCPSTGSTNGDCFATTKIAGNIADPTGGMECPTDDTTGTTGAYLIGIQNGEPVCGDIEVKCGTGRNVIGINADGTLSCSGPPPPTPPGCSTETVSICAANDATLLAGPDGAQRTVSTGETRITYYQCIGGAWTRVGREGTCECTAGTRNIDFPCDRFNTGFTGTYTETCTTVCPGTIETCTNNFEAVCNCVGDREEEVYPCPPGQSGNITYGRDFVCDTPTTGHWTDITRSDTCTACVAPAPTDREVSCDGGLTGTKWQVNTFDCATGTWSGWVDDPSRNYCTCTPSVTTQHDPCPTPLDVGYVINEYTVTCPGATTTVRELPGGTCAPPPPVICSWVSIGSERLETSRIGNRLGDSPCTCGQRAQCWRSSGSGYFISTCSCE